MVLIEKSGAKFASNQDIYYVSVNISSENHIGCG